MHNLNFAFSATLSRRKQSGWKKSQKDPFLCLTKHLKSVMIYGYVTEACVFELIEFLLKKALVLEKMVISTNRTLRRIHPYEFLDTEKQKAHLASKELLEFSQKLLNLEKKRYQMSL